MNTVEFLRAKRILIIGATGFLGKVFLEKILRVQPEVGRIYTLIRAENAESAQAKLQNEVISKELFRLLRKRYRGDSYQKFMTQKLVPVVGDVTLEELGIDQSIKIELCSQIDMVVNAAATTSFFERYDVAMKVNALGTRNLINFCKGCSKLKVLCHISTAYVNVASTGIVAEEALTLGERNPYNGGEILPSDIESECKLIAKTVKEFRHLSDLIWSEETETKHMQELGLQRARKFGWPNAYVFTKAMGEMVLENMRENIPTIIIRPSIIESTLTEPFPGWMEGNRMLDPVIIAYGKGRITSFLADPLLILDVIPVDMVSNFMIASIARHAFEPGLYVYQVSSSVANPLKFNVVADSVYKYFSTNPCVSKNGNIVKVKRPHILKSMSSFRLYMTVLYKFPLQLLRIVDKLVLGFLRPRYNRLLDKYRFTMRFAQLYEPFLFFKGKFNNSNVEELWNRMLSEEEQERFMFDVKCIDWNAYFLNCHIPGLVKYIMR